MALIFYKNTYSDLRNKKLQDLQTYITRTKQSVKKMLSKLSRGFTNFKTLERQGQASITKAEEDVEGVAEKAESFAEGREGLLDRFLEQGTKDFQDSVSSSVGLTKAAAGILRDMARSQKKNLVES